MTGDHKRGKVLTCTLHGADALPVTVEVDIGSGLPGMNIVGLPDAAVQEAKQRVRSAIRTCGFQIPNAQIVVNLAPGRLRKTGTGFDLPIAVAILVATGQIQSGWIEGSLVVGELGLDGEVRPVAGLLACALAAHRERLTLVCAPTSELSGYRPVATHALEGLWRLRGEPRWSRHPKRSKRSEGPCLDYAEIAGQDAVKRALQIAAAGGHGVLMKGPPGSGKTMLARRLPTILPPLTEAQREETALIHSVAGLDTGDILAGIAPFRSPHHSSSKAGLIGGGNPLRPGEASLAHNGVLFLDEMSEFASSALQALRQPFETGEVTLSRAEGKVTFPARFMLVGAANPCPCGFLGDPEKACSCGPLQIARYASRIGGPLMDRIDLVVDVWRTDPSHILESGRGKGSAELKEGVSEACEFAKERMLREGEYLDSLPPDRALIESCHLGEEDRMFFEDAARRGILSGRGMMRTLRVARTIADLARSEKVERTHLVEALGYRLREDG